jgi:hypothetical protein
MFRRLAFEDSAALFTIAAFVTALSIYVAFAWRALRMKAPQVAKFENLPFATPTPEGGSPACGSPACGSPGFESPTCGSGFMPDSSAETKLGRG